MAVVPSLKVTVPLGVPLPGATAPTLAVKTTAWPNTVGLVELVNVVVLLSALTTWLRADEVLVLKFPSALYTAVIEWVETERAEVTKVTTPPLSVLVASEAAPSLKVTVPLGVPTPGKTALTVAVKVTFWPKTDGFCDETTAVLLLALLTTWLKAEEEIGRAHV